LFFVSRLILFFFNVAASIEIYTLSLHDALPILKLDAPFREDGLPTLRRRTRRLMRDRPVATAAHVADVAKAAPVIARRILLPSRSEEHTSELQSRENLVCRLLLVIKKKKKNHL